MGTEHETALEVLREVWRGQGQTTADLDDASCERSCKRMTDAGVGFDDFGAQADADADADAQADANAGTGKGTDLNAAWRARLEREGKLNRSGLSVRDLVLGQAEPR